MNGWHFDPYSALIGAAVTLLLVGLAYRFRRPISDGWAEIKATLQGYAGRISAGVEGWYRDAVEKWAQQAHALSRLGKLDQIFVLPPLLASPLQANTEAVSLLRHRRIALNAALVGHNRLLLVGEPGSGRSTLLAYLALLLSRQQGRAQLGLPSERFPIYVHLAAIDLSPPADEQAQKAEPPQPPAVLAQEAVRAVSAPSAAAGLLQKRLQMGHCVVLVDGWDELGEQPQAQATAWLTQLVETLPGNIWLIAVGPRGFAPLAEKGFVPLYLGTWENAQIEALLTRLVERLLTQPEARQALPLRDTLDQLGRALETDPAVLSLALRAWLTVAYGAAPEGRSDLYGQAIERLIAPSKDEIWLSTAARTVLGHLALKMQQQDRWLISRAEIEEEVNAALPPAEERPARAVALVVQALTAPGGILTAQGEERYAFLHPLWQAYLAARQLLTQPADMLAERLEDRRWLPVADFYAEAGQMEPLLKAWLSRPDDLWRSRLRRAARWASFAPLSASWRSGVMALLARAVLDPTTPAPVRERLAEAIARTGDPGVLVFLRQACQHPQPAIRAVAVFAMGLLHERADTALLVRALDDEAEQVKAAAAGALARLATPAAIRLLTQALVEGDEALQVEAARGLATLGEEGWDILRQALREDDFLVRRAACHGLAGVRQPWAQEALERTMREDPEWIVRSAASTILSQFEAEAPAGINPPPVVSELGWLIAWAATRGSGVGMGEAAFEPLLEALQEGDPPVRRAAAQTLGLVGRLEHAGPLRQAVQDSEPEVASAALWALEELASRYGVTVR